MAIPECLELRHNQVSQASFLSGWLIRVVPREALSSLSTIYGRGDFFIESELIDRSSVTMKTKLLYHENSFTYEFTATVVAVEGDEIALDATVFYPGGGGQMADHGVITWNGGHYQANVIAMNKRSDIVWHTIDCPPPSIGAEVVGTIDWDFRYQMMRTHTALHILCGIIWKEFGVQVTGGQMYPDRARMDFAMENLDRERIAIIEQKVNEAIEADYPLRVYSLPREKAFEIPDLVRTKINLLPPDIQDVRIV